MRSLIETGTPLSAPPWPSSAVRACDSASSGVVRTYALSFGLTSSMLSMYARHLQLLLRWRRAGLRHPALRGQHLVGMNHRGQQHHLLAIGPDRSEVAALA